MTQYGLLSDVHGNLEALEVALAFLREREVSEILCLGDLVGYCAESNACVALLDRARATSIAGNHDLIALGRMGFERCAAKPRFALQRTRRDLTEATRRSLAALPTLRLVEDDIVLVHGTFDDPAEYMTSTARLLESDAAMRRRHPRARVCLFGHTHEPKLYALDGVTARELPRRGEIALDPRHVSFVNPGSIDASRKDGVAWAELAIFDADRRTVAFHALPYDAERVERRARRQGYRMGPADAILARAARLAEWTGRAARIRIDRGVTALSRHLALDPRRAGPQSPAPGAPLARSPVPDRAASPPC